MSTYLLHRHAYQCVDEDESAYSQDSHSPRRDSRERYSPGGYSPGESTARPNNDSGYFPSSNYFPPPPTAPVDGNLPNAPYPPYNPADYPPHNNYGPPPPSGGYIHEDMNPGNPYARQDQNHYYQARRGDDNVSAPVPVNSGAEHVTPISTRGGFNLPTHLATILTTPRSRQKPRQLTSTRT